MNSNDNDLTAQVLSIPYEATEAELQTFFEDSNPIRVKIIVDFATQRSKGFGFVTFASQNDLENALQVTRISYLIHQNISYFHDLFFIRKMTQNFKGDDLL